MRPLTIAVRMNASLAEAKKLAAKDGDRYAVGAQGWVKIKIDGAPIALLEKWIEESYRAIAPKTLVKQLD